MVSSVLGARAVAVVGVTVATLFAAPAAGASVLPTSGNLLLAGTADVPIAATSNQVFAPGDVNGDGRADIAVGFPTRTEIYLAAAGTAAVSTSSPGRLVFVSHGSGEREVAVGDLTGDGRDDIVTLRCSSGIPGDAVLRTLPAASGAVPLSDLKAPRVRFGLPGLPAGGCVRDVTPLGDLDADGFDDVLLAWTPPEPATDGSFGARRTVVFGAAALPATVDLAAPGAGGYRLRGKAAGSPEAAPTPSGWTGSWDSRQGWDFPDLRAAGDVNGDGYDDYALIRGDETGPTSLYVVLSGTTRSDLTMTARSGRAIRIANVSPYARIGRLGDLNGDGLDDLAVGVPDAFDVTRIVRGRTATTDLTMSTSFPSIDGELVSAAPAGDINGDGLHDAAVLLGGSGAGRSAVIFGRTSTAAITVPAYGAGFATGLSAPGALVPLGGDWNGDGRSDLFLPGSGVLFGYAPGTPPVIVDTIAPVLSNLAVGPATWNTCGVFGQKRRTIVGALTFAISEGATLDVSVRQGSTTRSAKVVVPPGATSAPLPSTLIEAASGTAQVTVQPVDAAGNRGVPTTLPMPITQTGYYIYCEG